MGKIELLAPAGTTEAFRAAIENGADAVYLGGSMFSARQYASNFSFLEVKEAISFAHERDVKVYVAVNTLVANEELDSLFSFLYQLAEAQTDALIVQDLGVANIIRKVLPQMEIHASTQMAIHNSSGVQFLENLGFTRAVLAREVSFENIKLIKEHTTLELETFVHGALCIGFSGQCLMSSMIGGRSGNRGRCAQPCRMKYSLVDQDGKVVVKNENVGEHLLSPRDLKMIQHIPELIKSGITSLKVEGRMKRPEYVATVVKSYREAIDNYYHNPQEFSLDPLWEKKLEQIFNRNFTTGYYLSNQGKDLMSYRKPNNRGLLSGRISNVKNGEISVILTESLSVGDGYEVWSKQSETIAGEVKDIFYKGSKITKGLQGHEVVIKVVGKPKVGDLFYKTHDVELMQEAQRTYLSSKVTRKIDLDVDLILTLDKGIGVVARDAAGYNIEFHSDYHIEEAKKHPVTFEILWQQLSRLGNTPFQLKTLDAKINGELMVPISELNRIRRRIVDGLLARRHEKLLKNVPTKVEYLASIEHLQATIPKPKKNKNNLPKISVLVGNLEGVKAAVSSGADLVYFNWEGLKNRPRFTLETIDAGIKICQENDVKAILSLPRIIREKDKKRITVDLQNLRKKSFQGVLVGNAGSLYLAQELEFLNIYADYSFNIFNDYTIEGLLQEKIVQATLSPELTLEQIKKVSYLGQLPLEAIIHGNFPLMISEHCVAGSILGNMNTEKNCGEACYARNLGLKDRMSLIFPLEMDINCRMLVYNSKSLNLYKDLESIFKSGINIIRIEALKENADWIKIVTKIYKEAIENWFENSSNYQMDEESRKTLEKLDPNGFTTGHFFRGVL